MIVEPVHTRMHRWRRVAAIIGVVLIAAWLRIPAWRDLPYDIDERVYLPLAERYATALERGQLATLTDPFDNPEHPALTKLLFAVAIAAVPGSAPTDAPGYGTTTSGHPAGLHAARLVSLIASLLLAALLAWRNPLAGLVFAFSSWQIKYGVVAYLEAVPGLLATAALLCAERWWLNGSRRWLIGAGALIGAAGAAKYPYAIIAAPTIGLLIGWRWWQQQAGWRDLLIFAAATVLLFGLLDPFAWRDPLGTITSAVGFHVGYSENDLVQSQHFAPWHHLALLFKPMPYDPFFPFSLFNTLRIETVLTTLGLLSLPLLWRRSPPLALWLTCGLMFLLLWPTKWAHYTLLVIPGLSLSAGVGLTWLLKGLRIKDE